MRRRAVTAGRRRGPRGPGVVVLGGAAHPVQRSADVAAATGRPGHGRRRGRLLQRPVGRVPAPHGQHVSPRDRRRVLVHGRRRRWLDHRRQPAPGARDRAQVLPGQDDGERTARQAARARRRQAPVARGIRPRTGSRVFAVRSASGRAPVAAPRDRQPSPAAATAIVRRGVQVVLETAVVRDQIVSGHVHAVVVAAAAAATGGLGEQRGAVGRGARAKVRFQRDRGQGLRRRSRLLRVDDDRFQRLSKRSHGHVG